MSLIMFDKLSFVQSEIDGAWICFWPANIDNISPLEDNTDANRRLPVLSCSMTMQVILICDKVVSCCTDGVRFSALYLARNWEVRTPLLWFANWLGVNSAGCGGSISTMVGVVSNHRICTSLPLFWRSCLWWGSHRSSSIHLLRRLRVLCAEYSGASEGVDVTEDVAQVFALYGRPHVPAAAQHCPCIATGASGPSRVCGVCGLDVPFGSWWTVLATSTRVTGAFQTFGGGQLPPLPLPELWSSTSGPYHHALCWCQPLQDPQWPCKQNSPGSRWDELLGPKNQGTKLLFVLRQWEKCREDWQNLQNSSRWQRYRPNLRSFAVSSWWFGGIDHWKAWMDHISRTWTFRYESDLDVILSWRDCGWCKGAALSCYPFWSLVA